MNDKRKQILLVHLFSNGDCLYATAIARQIKQDFPGCELTWAIAGFCKNIIAGNPFVDHVLETNEVAKNDVPALRKLKKKLQLEKKAGRWDEVFITLNMDENQAYYDGCIRTGIYHAYPYPITVDTTPVLKLTEAEKTTAAAFAMRHELQNYKTQLLFEFAPQSGQLPITKEFALRLAERLVANGNVAVILSSAFKIEHPDNRIIDGSTLNLRETAALTFHCSHLLGCSSGITWVSTADGARQLPMVQLIDPDTPWINAVSRDFQRFNRSTENIIDLLGLDEARIEACLLESFNDFAAARAKYNEVIPLKFVTTKKIVYNLISRLQFRYIAKHINVNRQAFGNNPKLYAAVLEAFFFFPFTLLRNRLRKRVRTAK